MDRLRDCRETAARTETTDAAGNFDAQLFLVTRNADSRMAGELAHLNERLETFDREITTPVRDRLRTAAVRERAVETLVDRRRALAERERMRQEGLQLDEHGQHSWRRRAQGG